MMMNIQIDHKTIRELMAADHTFAIKVKAAILETAVKHECWRAIDTDTKRMVSAEITRANAELKERLRGSTVLSPDLRVLIDARIKEDIDRALYSEIRDGYEKAITETKEIINARACELKGLANSYIDKTINKGVAAYISDEVSRRIAEVVEALRKPVDLKEAGDGSEN